MKRRTHDHTRHGTTSLFAASDVASGAPQGEFSKFLDQTETSVPAEPDVHLVMDNCATHKTRLVPAPEPGRLEELGDQDLRDLKSDEFQTRHTELPI